MSSSSSLWLMTLYTIVALVLQALTIGVIFVFEGLLGAWSGPIFITAYFLMFWVAWPIALRMTEPKDTEAIAQKA